MARMFEFVWQLGARRFGVSHQIVRIDDAPYLERWILWLGVGTLRLHKFWRSDSDRAFHDHPFWYVTIPLNKGYFEHVQISMDILEFPTAHGTSWIYVRRLRPSFRTAEHRHIVTLPLGAKPLWTFVVTGVKTREWGFWPTFFRFVPWREWEFQQRKPTLVGVDLARPGGAKTAFIYAQKGADGKITLDYTTTEINVNHIRSSNGNGN